MESTAGEDDEKLVALRRTARDGFDALDRGDATEIEGNEQLGALIARIGGRAARRVGRRAGAK
jgi:hypothetical protein